MDAPVVAESYRIGLIADTHDVDDPLGVVESLAAVECDFHVHLGDIGGSSAVMRVVREFKRQVGDVSHLPPDQRSDFQQRVDGGSSRLRAYIETRLGDHNLVQRTMETGQRYRAIFDRMSQLPNPILLYGNVDGYQLRSAHIQAGLGHMAVELTSRPRLIDLGWLGLILWPSWRSNEPTDLAEQRAITDTIAGLAAKKEQVFVVAHEQCFKGPSASVYASNVAKIGLRHRSIPRFDPNPTWRCLLSLFRRLPADVPCYLAFGHVHDSEAVIRAGAPALRNQVGPGLRYRLYGLAWRGLRPASRGRPASIVQLPVGVNEIASCELKRGAPIVWNVNRYEQT